MSSTLSASPRASRFCPIVIRNANELAAYLYGKPAPQPASSRVCAMVMLDRKLTAIITGR